MAETALLLLLVRVGKIVGFTNSPGTLSDIYKTSMCLKAIRGDTNLQLISIEPIDCLERRFFLYSSVSTAALMLSGISVEAAGASSPASIDTTLPLIREARAQLDPIPDLIKSEKWDSVRAILITPPISDAWSKTSKLLQRYAESVGELPDGDELAALELKEEALDHLRFLDMAVYNNVFNPIKTEGQTGATKELIRSYYEDPINEYNAVVRVFDNLIELSK